ncbi:hypothetical protein [Paenibacillus senegalensis]|uniref:hypothetical protein n=1 Tax=Paenibacillus senegalensis TaxID=1465766 RepID=UPI000287AE71|nr:hypothetical protein [Paenibacillus senegalensis]
MSKIIQAYFKTEDDAESARIKLMTFETKNLEVGELDGTLDTRGILLFPYAAGTTSGYSSPTGMGAGVAGERGIGAVAAYNMLEDERDPHEIYDEEEVEEMSVEDFNYVLSAEVKEEEYKDIVRILRQSRGSVEVLDEG